MTRKLKKVHGQLFDLDNYTLLGHGDVNITFIEPPQAYIRPEYHATITIEGCRLDLNHKACVLQFNKHTAGEVRLAIPVGLTFGVKQTTFQVHWQDSNWNNLDWFQSL
jgi:hypothetical protein